jgi:hypothetical protein
MVNANSLFGGMLTTQGAAKKTNCDALGIPWEPRYMLIGDANGADPVPDASQTQLIHQVYRAQLNQLRVSPTDDNILIAELVLPPDVGGWWIRELALEDKDGVFSAVANAAPSYKPLLAQGSGRNQVVRMHIITTGTANIQLKIDPSVVLATREYVDQKVLAELSKQDFKHSVLVATTGPVVLSGLQTVDGVPLPAGARVLVKNQAAPNDNGLYSVAAGAWTRSTDADSSLEVTPGLFVHVERGTANGDSIWQLVTDAPLALGATDLLFEMAAGRTGINAGTYRSVTVDKYGRVVGGTNPTTLAGYGIDVATQAEAEAQTGQDNTKPMTALRVWQAITKKFALFFHTGLTDATIGKGMLVGAGGLMGAVEPFTDANAIPWRTGFFGASGDTVLNGPAGATSGDPVRQEVFNQNAAVQHWTCYAVNRKYTRRWQVNAWTLWDEDLTVSSVGAQMTATQAQTNSGVDDTKYVTPKKFAAGVAALVIQATEAVKGLAKIATQAQVNAGSGDDVIVTPVKLRFGFLLSLNAQGYVVFPQFLGGLVIQWTSSAAIGPGATGAAYWAMAFPVGCIWALASPLGNSGNNNPGNIVAGGVSPIAVNLYNWGNAISAPARVIGFGV